MFHVKHFENKQFADLTAHRGEWRNNMNEIMITEKINALTNTALKDSLGVIQNEVLSVNASQWVIAKQVHDILTKETFKDDFNNEEEFANFIGISRSNCNKMKKAIDFRDSNEVFDGWSLNKVYEIMCLPKEEAPQLLTDYMIDKNDTVKEIREAVKAYKEDTAESKVVAEVTPTEETENTDKTPEETAVEERQEVEKESDTRETMLHNVIMTLSPEEVVKVLSYMKKQHIGDTDAVNEVIKLWK